MSDIYELQNSKRKKNADKILYEYGLWNFLSKIGQPHIIGSKRGLRSCTDYFKGKIGSGRTDGSNSRTDEAF